MTLYNKLKYSFIICNYTSIGFLKALLGNLPEISDIQRTITSLFHDKNIFNFPSAYPNDIASIKGMYDNKKYTKTDLRKINTVISFFKKHKLSDKKAILVKHWKNYNISEMYEAYDKIFKTNYLEN